MESAQAIQEGSVTTSIAGGIASITFFHPLSNSLPGRVLRELAAAIDTCGKAEEIRVIVLRSQGDKTFCAGASFDELSSIQDLETGKTFFSGFAGVINAARKCPKLIIGRVQGKAVGGGVGMAAACDYVFATLEASVKLSELAVGIGPFVVGPAVERKIGLSAMSELAINATEWRSAEWAKNKGLYNEVYPGIAEMDLAIEKLAFRLASGSPEAMEQLKTIFWEGTAHWDTLLLDRAAVSGELVLSEYSKNAIARFKAK
jgi:methylglutaconyl-CoA hydratase